MAGFIHLRLYASLASKIPSGTDRYPIDGRTTVADVLEALDIPRDQARLVFVNGRKQPHEFLLKDGDRVGIFPPVGGG